MNNGLVNTYRLQEVINHDPSMALVEIGGVLLLLGLLTVVAEKLKLSVVPFYLLAGLAFGKGGLFPLALSEDFLKLGAEIGALLLLLMLGLEYSARDLANSMQNRWHLGLIDFAANAVPAGLLAFALGYGWFGALAFSGIMFVSSSGIASQLMRETGWARSEVAKRTTGILVIEDLLLAPYLPLISTIALGVGLLAGVISVGIALGITVLIFVISFKNESFLSGFLNRLGASGLLLVVFGAAMLFSGSSTLIGFSGAVAAFLFGLLLAGEVAQAVRRRLAPLRDLFSAIFFVFFGLSTSALDVLYVLPIALAFLALGVVGKMVVGYYTAKDMHDNYNWRRVGAFLVPRGEFSMVIASIVAVAGKLANVQAITLTVVILSTFVSSILLRFFRSKLDF